MLRLPSLVAALAVVAAGCTTPAESSHDGAAVAARVRSSAVATGVVPGESAAELAVGTSAVLFDRAPQVVLADSRDLDGQARGASVAVSLGAPLLLTSSPAPPAAPAEPGARRGSTGDPLATELARLRARTLLAVGARSAARAKGLGRPVRMLFAPRAVAPARPTDLTRAADLTRAVARLRRDSPGAPPGERALVLVTASSGTPVAAAATARAAGADVLVLSGTDPRGDPEAIRLLSRPRAGSTRTVLAVGDAFGPPDRLRRRLDVAATGAELPGGGQVVFPGRRIVALYGHPGAPALGVLGEQPVAAAIARARRVAAAYHQRGGVPVVPAFDLVATVASAGAGPDGNYSTEAGVDELRPWVDAAQRAGLYVVLDLQPGRTDFLTQAKRYEQLLARPNVGLALDPEWRLGPGQRHLRQVGGVDVDEVNRVVAWLAGLVRARHLPQKLVVLHQFRLSMLRNRERLDTGRDEVAVLIQMDGHGPPQTKRHTWQAISVGAPPHTWFGWKNFYDEDRPMWTPHQTLGVRPSPWFVSYQ